MVFSGTKEDPGPYSEDHPIEENMDKLTWYGYTKAQGEKVLKEVLGSYASIVRILNPVRSKFDAKLDYIRKPLKLFDEGKLYPMFSDQQISITFIDELCEMLDILTQNDTRGTFHASSYDTTTPYKLISEVIKKTRGNSYKVRPIIMSKYLDGSKFPKYRYPQFGGLSVSNTQDRLDYSFSSWQDIIIKLVSQGLGEV
jgi:dTDP-4-dehydrorhamnose reductase